MILEQKTLGRQLHEWAPNQSSLEDAGETKEPRWLVTFHPVHQQIFVKPGDSVTVLAPRDSVKSTHQRARDRVAARVNNSTPLLSPLKLINMPLPTAEDAPVTPTFLQEIQAVLRRHYEDSEVYITIDPRSIHYQDTAANPYCGTLEHIQSLQCTLGDLREDLDDMHHTMASLSLRVETIARQLQPPPYVPSPRIDPPVSTNYPQAAWKRTPKKKKSSHPGRRHDVCDRCRRPGHHVARCTAEPPNRKCPLCQEYHWIYDCPRQEKREPPSTSEEPSPSPIKAESPEMVPPVDVQPSKIVRSSPEPSGESEIDHSSRASSPISEQQ